MFITYLQDYREEEPEWIARYLRGEKITFKDIMSTRVGYYPGSGFDGELMKVGNKSHSVHSFLYVDYMLKKKELESHLAEEGSILGYHPVGQIEWQESDLMPNGQYPLDMKIEPLHAEPNKFVRKGETPYCFSVIMERNEDKDDAWVLRILLSPSSSLTALQLITNSLPKSIKRLHGFSCSKTMDLEETTMNLELAAS